MLLRGRALDRPQLTQIIERTDGVPLSVEELTKAVLESGDATTVLSGAAATGLNMLNLTTQPQATCEGVCQ
jgi:hypothetical protein